MIDIRQELRAAGCAPGKDACFICLEEPVQPEPSWTDVYTTHHGAAHSCEYLCPLLIHGWCSGPIVDARAGLTVSNACQSVSLIAGNCVMAGILSTAAFILGAEEGLALIREQRAAEGCIYMQNARHQTRRFSSYVPV